MSIEAFVMHGYHRGLFLKRPGGPYGEVIELYDIGEVDQHGDIVVGARYPDNARQAQPIAWHARFGALRAFTLHRDNRKRVRPALQSPKIAPLASANRAQATQTPTKPRPVLQGPTKRPALRPKLGSRKHG